MPKQIVYLGPLSRSATVINSFCRALARRSADFCKALGACLCLRPGGVRARASAKHGPGRGSRPGVFICWVICRFEIQHCDSDAVSESECSKSATAREYDRG